jgi:hypothetical protein
MTKPLPQKLGIKPGCRLLTLGAPDGYVESLEDLPERVEAAQAPDGQYDVVHLFIRDSHELRANADAALAAVKPGGVFWVSYPKKSSGVPTDITRDKGWEPLREAGWRPVSQVSVDDTWSALRFRPEADVGR